MAANLLPGYFVKEDFSNNFDYEKRTGKKLMRLSKYYSLSALFLEITFVKNRDWSRHNSFLWGERGSNPHDVSIDGF
jgi:hypothetical protein